MGWKKKYDDTGIRDTTLKVPSVILFQGCLCKRPEKLVFVNLTVVGEHVVEFYDEVVVPVEPFKSNVRCSIYVREVLIQLHL